MRRLAWLLMVLSSLSIACSGSGDEASDSTSEPTRGGDAVVLIHEPTAQDMNKLTTFVQGTFWCTEQVFEALTFVDQEGQLQPLLAEEWEVSDDDLSWTFRIREGVEFSDGTPMDADDVAFSIEDAARPENPIGILLQTLESVEAVDPSTVEVRLKSPNPGLPEALAGFNMAIVPEDWGGQSEEVFYENPVGTGPFMIDSAEGAWVKGTEIRFIRNDNYWQEGKPYLDSLTIRTVNEEEQRILQLRGNQAHLIFGPDVSQPALDLEQSEGITVYNLPTYRTLFMGLNVGFEPFADEHVRRAIAHAIDRESLRSALFDFPIISGSYIPTELSVHDPEAGLPFDLELAKEELRQSDYADGFEVSLLIDAGSTQESTLAQVLQEQLAEIGVTLNIRRLDLGARIEALVTSEFEMIVQDINQVTADPAEMTAWAVEPSFGAFFFTGYDDPELADLATQAGREADPDQRAELYSQVQQQVAEAAYIIVPYNLPNIWSSTDRLQDIELGLADAIDFTNAYIAD